MSMFTKQHYEAIAKLLGHHRGWAIAEGNTDSMVTLIAVDMGFALMFSEDNPRFKPELFINRISDIACDTANHLLSDQEAS